MILNDLDLQLNYFLNKNIDINIILNSQLIQLRNNEEKIYNYLNEYNKITQNKSTDYNLTIKDFYNNIDDKQNIKFKEFYVKYSFIFIFFIIFRSYINDINNFKILNNNIIEITYLKVNKQYLNKLLSLYNYKCINSIINENNIIEQYELLLNINIVHNKLNIIPTEKYEFYFCNQKIDNSLITNDIESLIILKEIIFKEIPQFIIDLREKNIYKNNNIKKLNNFHILYDMFYISNIIKYGNTKRYNIFCTSSLSYDLWGVSCFIHSDINYDLWY